MVQTERAVRVVEADLESEPCTFPCYVPGLERQAKVLAQLRMRANALNAKEFRKSPSPRGEKRLPAPNFKVKTHKVLSPDAGIHETKTKHLKRPSRLYHSHSHSHSEVMFYITLAFGLVL